MNESSTARGAASWLFALTILISAYLLFLVQPLISKAILPWFGGSTSVWTTCLLFFQVMLLAGYGYAHFMAGLSGKTALRIHAALLIAAVVLLPITPSNAWKPGPETAPVQGIALLLLANVGLAYFLLASTGPLVQAWFARTYPDRSPYRLYALSNIGSFAALLMYPFVVEPSLTVKHQGWAWSGGFVVFAALAGAAALSIRATTHKKAIVDADDPMPPNLWNHVLWLTLPAFASALLLILTNHICLDVAVVPFLWVAPLSLYLLTFIICFDHSRWYLRGVWAVAGLACAALLATMLNYDEFDWFFRRKGVPLNLEATLDWLLGLVAFNVPEDQREDWNWAELSDNILLQTAAYLALLFTVCMVCHGELVRRKPHAASLTRFYLMISAGGALGGVAVALIAPLCFSTHFEFNIAMVASASICGLVLWIGVRRSWFQLPLVACAAVVVAMVIQAVKPNERDVIEQRRGFYGVLQVAEREKDLDGYGGYALFNGRILHGFQFHDPARRDEPFNLLLRGQRRRAGHAGFSAQQRAIANRRRGFRHGHDGRTRSTRRSIDVLRDQPHRRGDRSHSLHLPGRLSRRDRCSLRRRSHLHGAAGVAAIRRAGAGCVFRRRDPDPSADRGSFRFVSKAHEARWRDRGAHQQPVPGSPARCERSR